MIRPIAAALCAASISGLAIAQHLTEGASSSRVRVVIYEDLACSDCAAFRTMLDQQLLPRYAAKVVFEHRDFPLPKHPWARKAAIAARYFEKTKPGLGVQSRQYFLSNLSQITVENFNKRVSSFASEHGLDPAKALAALNDPDLAAAVEKDYQEGLARGIAHTPTVLVNATRFIETFAFQDVAKSIEDQLTSNR